MRGSNAIGRFDADFEVQSMRHGTSQDLQRPVGQSVQWFQYDAVATTVDPIYDVGDSTGGRVWKQPVNIPVVNAYVFQSQMYQNDRGYYAVDTLRLYVNYDDVMRYLPTLDSDPDIHILDRVEFRKQYFVPTRVFPRGQVTYNYMMLTVELTQVKPEEMVNDIFPPSPIAYPPNQTV